MIPDYLRNSIGESIVVTPNDDTIKVAKEILENRKRLGQYIGYKSFDRILDALVLERGFAKLIGGRTNPLEFDYTNPESYAYDIIGPNGEHIEVKRKRDRTFKWVLDGNAGKIDLSSFKKHNHLIDYLVGGDIIKRMDNEYLIRYDFIAKAKTFFDFERKSDYNSEYMYKSLVAMRRGDCYERI